MFRQSYTATFVAITVLGSFTLALAEEPKAAPEKQITNSIGMKLTLNAAQSPASLPAAAVAAPQGATQASAEPQYSGKPLSYWKVQAKAHNPQVCADAAEALGKMGPPALPTIMELARDKDAEVRCWAAVALGWMGPAAKDAIPTLTKMAKDSRVRGDATLALSRVGPAAIPALLSWRKIRMSRCVPRPPCGLARWARWQRMRFQRL